MSVEPTYRALPGGQHGKGGSAVLLAIAIYMDIELTWGEILFTIVLVVMVCLHEMYGGDR